MKPILNHSLWLMLTVTVSLLIGRGEAAPINQPPPVTFSVQPEENGKLVYLPIAAETENDPPSNLFGLRVSMMNNSTNEVRLTKIRTIFTFADNAIFAKDFTRDLVIAGEKGATEYLKSQDPMESIQLPEPAPVTAEIQLFFDGYLLPKTLERALAPYESPAPGGKYLFPCSDSDLGPDEYFSHVEPHTGGGQFFGYDFHVQGWNGQKFSSIKAGGDSSKNEDRVGWNMPIYAMADGVVIRASNGFEDNPTPGSRVIQRMDDHTGNAITDVKVTKLAENRAASLVRDPAGNLRITVWDVEDRGREIIQQGSVQGEGVDAIACDALSSSRLVTAVRLATGNLRVILWDISSGGLIDRIGEHDAAGIKEVSMVKISESRFATAVRTEEDVLRLMVWEVSGTNISMLSHEFAGLASSISVVALSETRLATSLRAGRGELKVILWELLDDGATLDRRAEATADLITRAVAVKTSGSKFDTVMRTAAGDLKVLRWLVSDDGESVTQELEASAGQIQDLAATASFEDSLMTAVITQDGNFKNILWRIPDPDKNEPLDQFVRWGEREAGTVDRLSIDHLDDSGLFFSGVRTTSGDLKVIAWWVGSGGGNNVVILHGNCRVLYAHFRDGSLNPAVAYPGAPVVAGQYLGSMGNSGSSEGPHTHIHADRVSSFLTAAEIIAQDAAGTLVLHGFRPVPFHCARAKRLDAIQQGDNLSTFSTMQGHGVYFAMFGIRPSWWKEMYVDGSSSCFAPTGRKNCTPIGPFSFGGAYPTVNQALDSDACRIDQLFIRAGTYQESVTFNRYMTVRSYDGTAIINP